MLTSHKCKTFRLAYEYLRDGTREPNLGREYYFGRATHAGEAFGKGAGRAAGAFGLDMAGGVAQDDFERFLAGESPTGERLIQTQCGKHVPGIDMVFAPPKSVSIEMIYATPERREEIEAAHLDSLRASLAFIEERAPLAKVPTGVPRETKRAPVDLMAFLFTHYTSRPTPGKALPDVGLHTHAFVMNMAWAAGSWRAIDHFALVARNGWQRAARYVYEMELTQRLEALGYGIDYHDEDRKGNRTWELAGSEKPLRDYFSSNKLRCDQIARKFEREHGRPPTYDEEHERTRASRHAKNEDCSNLSWEAYPSEVAAAGLSFRGHLAGGHDPRPLEVRRAEASAHLLGPHGLLKDDATFARHELAAQAYCSALGLLSRDEADDWLDDLWASGELVMVTPADKEHDYDRLTTRVNLRREMEATATAICMGYEQGPSPSKRAQDDAMRSFARRSGFTLDDEQIAGVRHLCGPQRWAHMVGWAGVGKTSALSVVIDAFKAKPRLSLGRNRGQQVALDAPIVDRVIVVAVTGSTAKRIGEELGADWCGSVEGLAALVESKAKRGKPNPVDERTLVILDEAVMADTPRLEQFTRLCRKAIVRCVGDPLQLEAIGAGGGFRSIDDAIGHIELTYVHRQRHDEDRWALSDLRHGRAGKALDSLERRGRLHLADDHEHAVGDLVESYSGFRKSGYKSEDVIVNTDAPNTEVDALNRLIQNLRMDWGEIGRESVTVEATRDKRVESFHRGDQITFTEGYEDDEHKCDVTKCPKCGGSGKRPFERDAEIKRCGYCKGKGSFSRSTKVTNGTRGVVTRVAPWGVEVRTSKGQTVSVYLGGSGKKVPLPLMDPPPPLSAATQPIRLAYAGHAARVQGAEAEIALVLPWRGVTDRGSAYSMTTRAREEVHVFCGFGKDKLAERWQHFDPKRTSEDTLAEQDYDAWPETVAQERLRGRGLERVG